MSSSGFNNFLKRDRLVRDLFTFTSKEIESFIIVKSISYQRKTRLPRKITLN
jgi:hypothetical protein